MLAKTLVKHGNSSALVIDQPILDLLGINRKTPLKITTDGQRLIIEPLSEKERAARFKAALEETDREYPKMFKRLAE
jgi:antitoxin MazE